MNPAPPKPPSRFSRAAKPVLLLCLGLCFTSSVFTAPALALDDAVTAGAPSDLLNGHTWRIAQFYLERQVAWPHPQNEWVPRPYLHFERGTLQGSPGCGQFTGSYRKSGNQLAISAKWIDNVGSPCNDDEKEDAKEILQAAANVRWVAAGPEYSQSDELVLKDASGDLKLVLLPMQAGKDLSELHDTFWRLKQLDGSTADLSQAVIEIDEDAIRLSTPSYSMGVPFRYSLTGLKFPPPFTNGGDAKNPQYLQDQRIAKTFEGVLYTVGSYEIKHGDVIFHGTSQHQVMVLSSLSSARIEDRKWRISKVCAGPSQQTDAEGLIDEKELAFIAFVNGQVSGTPGCGAFFGDYELAGDDLRLHAGAVVTGTGCAALNEPYIPNEPYCKNPYNSELRVEQRGDKILLRDKDGKAQLLLVPY